MIYVISTPHSADPSLNLGGVFKNVHPILYKLSILSTLSNAEFFNTCSRYHQRRIVRTSGRPAASQIVSACHYLVSQYWLTRHDSQVGYFTSAFPGVAVMQCHECSSQCMRHTRDGMVHVTRKLRWPWRCNGRRAFLSMIRGLRWYQLCNARVCRWGTMVQLLHTKDEYRLCCYSERDALTSVLKKCRNNTVSLKVVRKIVHLLKFDVF